MSDATTIESAVVVGFREFQSRRAVKQMSERRPAPRQFLWTLPGGAAPVVLGFQPLAAPVVGRYRGVQSR